MLNLPAGKQDRIKIAIDARFITGEMVGISRYLLGMLPYLIESNLELYWFVNTDHLKKFALNNLNKRINLIYAKSKPLSLSEHIELPFLLIVNRISLFHSPSYITPLWVPCKFVYSILDTYHLLFPEGFSRFASLYYRFIVKNAARRADIIMTISESSKKDIQTYLIKDNKVKVVYLGCNTATYSKNKNSPQVFSKNGIGRSFILFIGNHRVHKNLERVLRAYSRLINKVKDLPDIVVNLPETTERLLWLESDSAKAKCYFVGHIEESQLPVFYSSAIFLVAPSLYEGFGLFILEAMASGIPVITSNISSMPEVAGDAALLVNPYDIDEISSAMRMLLENEDLRKRYITKGIKRAKEFTWSKSAQAMLEIYNECLEKIER